MRGCRRFSNQSRCSSYGVSRFLFVLFPPSRAAPKTLSGNTANDNSRDAPVEYAREVRSRISKELGLTTTMGRRCHRDPRAEPAATHENRADANDTNRETLPPRWGFFSGGLALTVIPAKTGFHRGA